ncbi:large subunit ribosomal protein P2_2, cytoplasmic, partial [Guillardia theta CCMP2712]
PSAEDVKKLLNSVGAKADDSSINFVVKELNGKKLDEVIAAGNLKMASVGGGSGGGGGGGAAAPAAAAAAPAAGGKAAAKKEPEPEEEEDMGFSLFD